MKKLQPNFYNLNFFSYYPIFLTIYFSFTITIFFYSLKKKSLKTGHSNQLKKKEYKSSIFIKTSFLFNKMDGFGLSKTITDFNMINNILNDTNENEYYH